jgi:drug/metabolite transporter (DMT)-like permease
MNDMNKHKLILKGSLLAILTALCVALMGVFTKKIGTELPTSMLLFFRFAINFVAVIPLILLSKNKTVHRIPHPLHLSVRIAAALASIFCLLYSMRYIPLTDALLLNNTSSLFVPFFALFILKAKTPAKALVGIAVGFIGVITILHPGKEILSMGSIFALLAGIFASIAFVEMRLLSKRNLSLHMMLYYYLVSLVISAIYAAIQWQTPANHMLWLYLVLVGVFGTLYQLLITLTFKTAPVRLMSPLLFSSVIFGGIFDWVFWGITPSITTYAGGTLIIAGSILTLWLGSKAIIKQRGNYNETTLTSR